MSLPPPQPGLASSSSVRAMQSRNIACVAREIGDVLHEIDEDRLRPLEIVDHDDLRAFGRARLEEPPEGELRLRRRRADDRVGLDADRDQDLDERPVRDALAVREAPPTKDVGRAAHALEEVRNEARLPDARQARAA